MREVEKEEILKIFQESVEAKVKNKCLILSEQSLEKAKKNFRFIFRSS